MRPTIFGSAVMMPYLLILLVFILFSQQCHCKRMVCESSYPGESIRNMNICVALQDNDTGPCELWDTNMDVIDNTKVIVMFKLTSRNCSLYKFQLKVNESLGEINCVNTSNRYITQMYTEMRLNVHDKSFSSCEEMVSITFEDIPRGCYKLYYCTVNSESSEMCGQLVKYLDTNIKVDQEVKFEVPYLTPQQIGSNEVGITVSGYTRFDSIQLTVRPDNQILNCFSNSDEKRLTAWITRDVIGRVMCKRNTCSKCNIEIPGNKSSNKIECYEETENKAIKCEFKNIPIGNYCVFMHITDKHCRKYSHDCSLYQKFEIKEESMELNVPDSPISVYIVLAVVVGSLLFGSFITIVVICRRRWNHPQQVIVNDDCHSWLQSSEILLLYPRDCKAFMDMMATYREIIKERTGSKVYDCFDEYQFEDLSLNKVDWMRRHILHKNMKIVVVETACSALHQTALTQCRKLIYEDPNWLDDLFLFGLKLLTDTLDRNNYQRIFVVCIDGFTGERDSLNYLTPYTRYLIPQNLDLLLADLNVQMFDRNVIRMSADENENLQRFKHDLRNLIDYKGENPEYLRQLLSLA